MNKTHPPPASRPTCRLAQHLTVLKLPFFVSLGLSVLLLAIYESFRRVSNTKFLYDGKNRRRLLKMRSRTPDLPSHWGLDWLLYRVDASGGVSKVSVVDFLRGSVTNLPRNVRIFFNYGDKQESLNEQEAGGTDSDVFMPIIRNNLYQEEKGVLSDREKELLRLIGLDSYSFIRYLRFGFNISFYPFIVSAMILIPLYSSEPTSLSSFSALTIQNLPTASQKLWGACVMQVRGSAAKEKI